MSYKRWDKLFVSALTVIGLLIFFQIETASAGSDAQDGRKYPVDGGYYQEVIASGYLDQTDDFEIFSELDDPPGAISPNSAAALPDIRITPMGDSVTKGYGTCVDHNPPALDCIGYREDLWNALVGGGYPVDFVGSLGSAYQHQYTHDNDHEGHGGWKTTDINNNIYGAGQNWLQNYPTDIILLHIGTNDFTDLPLVDPNTVVTRVGQILDKIDDYESDKGYGVLVILAKIIKRYDPPLPDRTLAVENFNDALQTMANARISGGDNLIVVDMETALTYPGDFYDLIHPNATGYSKMSPEWYSALAGSFNFPPSLTNPGDQSSTQGQTISLQIQATDPENDSLTYSAAGLPAGLTINPHSGEISGKISSSNPSGSVFQVTITADDKTGFPYTDPYNKDQVTFSWKMGDQVVLPLVIR